MSAKSQIGRRIEVRGLTVSLSPIAIAPTDKMNGSRRVYRLLQEFTFTLSHRGGFQEIHIPEGFETDLASMPKIGELVIGRRDSPGVLEAAIIHDFLAVQKLDGAYTNCVMRYVLSVTGVPRWKQRAIFWAIMSFGPGSRLSGVSKLFKIGVSNS